MWRAVIVIQSIDRLKPFRKSLNLIKQSIYLKEITRNGIGYENSRYICGIRDREGEKPFVITEIVCHYIGAKWFDDGDGLSDLTS